MTIELNPKDMIERLCQLAWQEDSGEWNDELEKEYKQLKAQILENQWKAVRYELLKDRYNNWNEKHFGELCELYFEKEND